jgi:outer membrane protein assembly factor BamB
VPPGAKGEPAEVAAAAAQWPLPGQNYDNARAGHSTIDAANVARIKVAWSATGGLGALTTAPIVAGDTVYLQDSNGMVVALDARTGARRWASTKRGFNIGPFGIALGDGRVYADDGVSGVVALDARTGTPVWSHQLSTTKTIGIDIQPTVFGGMVFVATVPVSLRGIYTPGDRGILYALDDVTGATRWSFDTVLGDLWGHPEINSGGGAWYAPAIDTSRRIVYFGTANPAPFPGTKQYPNGASRPGADLYTDSVVALDVDTGKLLWYHQVTPHDLFDRDQVHVLLAHVHGREVVVSAGKSGVVVGLDPDTGRVLWQTPVGKHDHDDGPLSGPTEVYPGTYGGVETPPATADGVVYVATLNSPTKLQPDATAYFPSQTGTSDGEVVAIDASNGRVLWLSNVPGDPFGGATVVNDLVFSATGNGHVVALRRSDGRIVWRFDAPGGVNGWMTAAGDTLYLPVSTADPPRLLALRLSS